MPHHQLFQVSALYLLQVQKFTSLPIFHVLLSGFSRCWFILTNPSQDDKLIIIIINNNYLQVCLCWISSRPSTSPARRRWPPVPGRSSCWHVWCWSCSSRSSRRKYHPRSVRRGDSNHLLESGQGWKGESWEKIKFMLKLFLWILHLPVLIARDNDVCLLFACNKYFAI